MAAEQMLSLRAFWEWLDEVGLSANVAAYINADTGRLTESYGADWITRRKLIANIFPEPTGRLENVTRMGA